MAVATWAQHLRSKGYYPVANSSLQLGGVIVEDRSRLYSCGSLAQFLAFTDPAVATDAEKQKLQHWKDILASDTKALARKGTEPFGKDTSDAMATVFAHARLAGGLSAKIPVVSSISAFLRGGHAKSSQISTNGITRLMVADDGRFIHDIFDSTQDGNFKVECKARLQWEAGDRKTLWVVSELVLASKVTVTMAGEDGGGLGLGAIDLAEAELTIDSTNNGVYIMQPKANSKAKDFCIAAKLLRFQLAPSGKLERFSRKMTMAKFGDGGMLSTPDMPLRTTSIAREKVEREVPLFVRPRREVHWHTNLFTPEDEALEIEVPN